jgi:hypothetical protein
MNCSVEDCDREAARGGMCGMHYSRVWQKKNALKCRAYQATYRARHPEIRKENDRIAIQRRKTPVGKLKAQEINHRWYRHDPATTMWHAAKSRAKDKGIIFTLNPTDIIVPTHCPVLGIPLFIAERGRSDNSPSLDRLHPEFGYVKGNVQVISFRANRIKNDATLDEIDKLHAWMHKQQSLLQ